MSMQETARQLGHLVDGEIVRGEQTFPVIDPFSGEIAAEADAAIVLADVDAKKTVQDGHRLQERRPRRSPGFALLS